MNVKAIARREPIVSAGAIVTAVGAVINATNAFGLTAIAPEQVDALNGAIVAMWPLLLVLRQLVWSPASVDRLSAERYQEGQEDAVGQMGRR